MSSTSNHALYVHIPFCEHICPYCDFTKLFYNPEFSRPYLEALFKEIDSYHLRKMKTIYLGGGTPTALNDEEFETLLKKVAPLLEKDGEFTCEANVENLTPSKIDLMVKYGVNRLSIGVQSTHDQRLKAIGRHHSYADVINVINLAKQQGITNINVDLMYGFPGQKWYETRDDVVNLLKLGTTHISIYSLTVSKGTKFYSDKVQPQNEDDAVYFYQQITRLMRANGFKRYEVSNYAKPGFESKHNLTYWHNEEYCGVGLGASGYLGNIRYTNTRSLKEYLEGHYKEIEEIVEKDLQVQYYLMTHLRLEDGFNLDEFKERFNEDILETKGAEIKAMIQRNQMQIKGRNLSFTDQGILLMDTLILDLFY